MPRNSSFESQSFNSFSINEDFEDNNQDPNINFYQTQISSLDTSNDIPNEVKEKLEGFQQKSKITIRTPIIISTKRRFLPQIQATIFPMRLRRSWKIFQQKSFSVLHLNIRSMSKNFELFREFSDSLCFTFSMYVCM